MSSWSKRFEVVRLLGEGGEGRVFAVRDAALGGRVVALKETHGPRAARLAREFTLLARLRHPHLVPVHDYFRRSPLAAEGEAPRAAYTQDLVDGLELRAALAAEPSREAALTTLDALADQLLAALVQLHAAGFAHLDLKPDNVLVERRAGPRARLVDFGVAARLGDRLDALVGSRSYLAPELEVGAAIGPGADLFALGVMIAECLLGSLREARALVDTARDQRRAALVAALGPAPGERLLPLAELCADLCEVDPGRRPASAAVAAERLGRARGAPLELVTATVAGALMRSGGLVGRERELAEVVDALTAGRVFVVAGPPGSGRATLIEAAVVEAELRGASVERWPAPETASVEGFRAALGRLVPGADAIPLAPEAADVAHPEAFQAALAKAAETAAAALSRLPLPTPRRALAVARPEDAPAPVRALLDALERAGHAPLGLVVRRAALSTAPGLELPRLDREQVCAFVASRFSPELAAHAALTDTLAAASAGLFGHLEATCELLVADGTVRLGLDGWALDEAALARFIPPPSLREAARARLRLLPAAVQEVAHTLAQLAAPVRPETLALALDLPPHELGVRLDALVAAALVRASGGLVALAEVIREDASALPPVLARRLAPQRDELPPPLAARVLGGAAGAASLLPSIREALAALRLTEAERLCELALTLAHSDPGAHAGPALIELLSLRADIADRLGPREAQREALRALAIALAPEDPRQLEARSRLFWTLTRMGDPGFEPEGHALHAQALAAGRPLLAAEVAVHLAITRTQRGAWDEAEPLLEAARAALPPDLPALGLRARIANNLGNVYAYRGELERARAAYTTARDLKRAEGDPVGERIALGNLALMQLELGHGAAAFDDLVASLELARRASHRRGEAWSCLTLAELAIEAGAHRYAARRAEAAAALAQELGDQLVEGDARVTHAEALLALGEITQSHTEATSGAARARAAGNRWTELRAEAVLAAIAPPEAAATALEALAANPEADPGTRRLAARLRAEVALAAGDLPTALRLLSAATAAPQARPARPGARLAAFELTRARALRLAGDELGLRAAASSAATTLRAWLASLPETPHADGVDADAAIDGPCRASAERLPEVTRLLALADELARVDAAAPIGPYSPETPRGGALASIPRDLHATQGPELTAALNRELVEVVRAHEAERAFLLTFTAPTGSDDGVTLLAARDADGEAVQDARRRLSDVALEAARRGELWRAPGPDGRGAVLVVPAQLPVGAEPCRVALVLQNRFVQHAFSEPAAIADALPRLLLLCRLHLLERALAEAASLTRHAQAQVRKLEAETTEEITALRRELESTREQLGPRHEYPEIIFASSSMKRMLRQVDRVVSTDLPVHIHGESGTGKELIARAIHHLGARKVGPFVPQNCTAIPQTLFESELFGHERGSFTGAMRASEGLFRRAHRGTLFLDEIGDLPLELQAKLLRVLETGEVRPVGATRSVQVDVRIVSATHRDLRDLIKRGLFREDLYYRLNVIRIEVPPLRERPDDIPVLVHHFLEQRSGARALGIDEPAMRALLRHPWPGNVRQLENELARAALLADGDRIMLSDLSPEVAAATRPRPGPPGAAAEAPAPGGRALAELGLDQGELKDRVDRLEAHVLREALAEARNNKSEVARVLGLSRAGLNLKLKRLGLWDGD